MSPADDLVRALGQEARDQRTDVASDPRWEKLAAGELDGVELDELRRLAASDPQIAQMFEAFRPLDDALKARIASTAPDGAAKRTPGGEPAVAAPPSIAPPIPIIVPVRPRARWWPAAAAALAIAAAGAVWVTRPTSHEGPLASLDVPPMPTYALAVITADRATRSAQEPIAGDVQVQRDSRLEIVLRPSTKARRPVGLRTFLVQSGRARAWSPPLRVSSDGAMQIAGTAGDLLGVPSGTWDVVAFVGAEEDLPADPAFVARELASADRPTRTWQMLRRTVRLVDSP